MQRLGVCSLIECDESTPDPRNSITWVKGKYPGDRIVLSFIVPQLPISPRQASQLENVSRIQLACAFHVAHGLGPAALPAVNVSQQCENFGVVWQGALRNRKLGAGALVIEISVVEMRGQSQMPFTRIRFQVKDGIDGRLSQGQPSGCVIDSLEVDRVMGKSEPIIGEEEGRIARDRLVKQIHRGGKVLRRVRTVTNLIH